MYLRKKLKETEDHTQEKLLEIPTIKYLVSKPGSATNFWATISVMQDQERIFYTSNFIEAKIHILKEKELLL